MSQDTPVPEPAPEGIPPEADRTAEPVEPDPAAELVPPDADRAAEAVPPDPERAAGIVSPAAEPASEAVPATPEEAPELVLSDAEPASGLVSPDVDLAREAVPSDAEPASELESDAGPAPDGANAAETEAVPEPLLARAPRRRGRTTVLIAAAAVLGVLAGAGVGYRIQYDREPTPLAPLAGAMPVQPKGAAPAAPALPASQDRAAIYGGNLLDLLVPVPKGAKDSERVWMSLTGFAEAFDDPAATFKEFATGGFQRSVRADWAGEPGTYDEVELIQFRDEGTAYASSLFPQWASANTYDSAYGTSVEIPGVTNGYVWPSGKPVTQDGYEPEYHGRALAQVGNILIEVFVDRLHPVTASTVLPVINEQLERL